MATKKTDPAKRIAENKKAAFNYFIEERFEAGMVLEGWEIKSLREGKVQLERERLERRPGPAALPAAFTVAPHLQTINHSGCFSPVAGI